MKIKKFSSNQGSKKIFNEVDFYFEDCQLNFILGKKNIGKTKILDLIADLDNSRSTNFFGFPPGEKIAYMAQDNHFNVSLTVDEILFFVAHLEDATNYELPEVIREIQASKFSELSFEKRKLLLIYLNTMVEKDLYLFDEPEAGLSLIYSQEIFGWFRELIEIDKTVIVATSKLDNIRDINNVNYIKNNREVLADNYLKIKSRMAF